MRCSPATCAGQVSAVGLADVGAPAHGFLPAPAGPFYDPEFRHGDTEAVYRALAGHRLRLRPSGCSRSPVARPGGETGGTPSGSNTLMPEFLRLQLAARARRVLTDAGVPLGRLRAVARGSIVWWQGEAAGSGRLRRNDAEFHAFHRRRDTALIAAEAPDDREVQLEHGDSSAPLLRDDF